MNTKLDFLVLRVDFSGGHSRIINLACNGVESHVTRMAF